MNVSISNVSLYYGDHLALKELSAELNGPKIYGLLGRNGAGKTSLLSLLASYQEASAGQLTINGANPFENAVLMQQVAFLYYQDFSDESSKIPVLLQGVERYRPHFDKEYAYYLVERFKLDQKTPLKKFSKGMQSAFNVVVGLASRAPLTIFDEVYLGMDAPSRDIFYKELLQDQQNHPRMIILSTHLVSEMDYLFDEVIILNKGEVLLQEEAQDLIAHGTSITGHIDTVNEFVHSRKQINAQHLGQTKSVMLYGELSEQERQKAVDLGLEIGPVSLQDLFIHLTQEEEVHNTGGRGV